MSMPEDDPRVEALLREATALDSEPLSRRDRLAETAIAAALVAAAVAMDRWLPGPSASPALVVALLVLSLVAQRVRFAVGSCLSVGTQVAVVPMLLLLHPALTLTLLVASGILVRAPEYLRGRRHPDHAILAFGDAWYAVGPALVLSLAAPGTPDLAHWPVYLAALAAQLIFDNLATTARMWLALGVSPNLQLRLMATGFAIDAALAPVGLLLALIASAQTWALALALPLLGLLAALGREREQRIQNALALSDAYRGSALLMGEMLEADDPYTGGEHSKGVLALALAVGTELDLDAREQRELEFAALLHDIGKLRVPDEILNKPGKLTPAEWAVIKRHPEDGQQMLDRIGGVLADVGLVVRGHHERWDGRGYPDGLAGAEIPLAARIICACDAYSAMTTNRPYRAAMPIETALEELRDCAGTQFDPAVVDALDCVIRREQPAPVSLALVA
ncbi:MAG TPA: HD-GYP domain-containing protein [Solirubrobacteraceae bacterium]